MQALVKHQWLLILGKNNTITPRWTVISRQRLLLCFPKLVSPENVVSVNALAHIDIYGAIAIRGNHSGKPSFTVKDSKGTCKPNTGPSKSNHPSVHFSPGWWKCQSTLGRSNQWAQYFKGRGEIRFTDVRRYVFRNTPFLIFIVPLNDICERESSSIPRIITNCIQFISKNGKDQQGIFRLSGSTSEIKEYTDLLDEGSSCHWIRIDQTGRDITFSRNSDVHAVAGLLKLFLRSLPDPLINHQFYHQFLATTGS